MPRRGRIGAIILLASLFLVGGRPASADHCNPIPNPEPIPGDNTTYCHTPRPSATPAPTPTAPAATPAPTAPARTAAPPAAPSGPTRTSSGVAATPEPTPFDIEVPDEEPIATTEIVVDPIDDTTAFEAEQSGGASNWIFGFIVGFFLGGLAGRMSWGLRRKRRQQIFG